VLHRGTCGFGRGGVGHAPEQGVAGHELTFGIFPICQLQEPAAREDDDPEVQLGGAGGGELEALEARAGQSPSKKSKNAIAALKATLKLQGARGMEAAARAERRREEEEAELVYWGDRGESDSGHLARKEVKVWGLYARRTRGARPRERPRELALPALSVWIYEVFERKARADDAGDLRWAPPRAAAPAAAAAAPRRGG
jgi:hypothetical protein